MSEQVVDYVVVGAGPAGIQLAYSLKRAGLDHLVVEAGSGPGTFFRTFPRHRTLISINKVHTGWDDPELNMRVDWNSLLCDDPELVFSRYNKRFFPPAEDFLRYLDDFVTKNELRIEYGRRIERIDREGQRGDFVLTDDSGRTIRAKRVVIATGVTKPYTPDAPGMELVEQYSDVSVDPEEFTDKRVLVLGKGNSAFETADNLIEHAAVIHVSAPHSVQLAWRTHFVGHLRAVNNNILDAYQLKLQHAILDAEVREVARDGDGYRVTFAFARVDEVLKDVHYDRIIACTGFRWDPAIFAEDIRPELTINDRFPDQTPAWESTNVPDLYFAGTITQVRDFKRSTSAFIHGFRYGARALSHVLASRYDNKPWPHRDVAIDAEALADAVLARVNRSSGLFQQFSFLADLLVVGGDGASYHEEVPIDYAHTGAWDQADQYLITLEYGPDHDKIDPFDITIRRVNQSESEHADEGHYLHPVIRRYRDGELVATHHVTENLENEWDRPVHREPLVDFFTRQLTGA